MSTTRHDRRRRSSVALIAIFLLTFIPALPVSADSTAQTPPFTQNWSNTGLIAANDNWSGVPGFVGFLGQDITTAINGADPQLLLSDSTFSNDVDVIANVPAANISNGGVGEFEIADPVVALQGSGTADAPYLLINVRTTGLSDVAVGYVLRDIDGTTDNTVQKVALHYRVGASGTWTNLPGGFVADATTGPSLATQVTPVSVVLPDATDDQALVQLRIMTTNATNNDEWVGIDDISIGPDQPPAVQSTTPANGADEVALDANLSVTFSEPVDVSGGWFDISCTTSGNHTATATGGTTTFSIDPDTDFVDDETCTFTVYSQNVKDLDATDPPDFMAADHVVSFSTPSSVPPPELVINEIDYDQPSTDTAEFLEIKNVGANAASLSGVSVAFINGSGTVSYRTTPLPNVSLAAGDYFVVCANAANTSGCDLDISPDTDLIQNGAPDALALVMGSTIIDTVSYEGDTGTPYTEGSGAGLVDTASASAGPESISRCPDGTDTNQNNLDFLLRPSTPGSSNACPGTDLAPRVTNNSPANGAAGVPLAADITLTFSEPVNVAGTWYAIDCTTTLSHSATVTGDGTDFTLDPTADFAEGESCTVTVTAGSVTDQDGNDPPDTMASNHTFTFTAVDIEDCADPSTPIHAIQGSGPSSPLLGQSHSIDGIVVGDYQVVPDEFGGFHLQESAADADADTLTSEGIFVFDSNFGVAVNPGDRVRVHGSVAEFNGLTELASVSFVAVCSTGNPLPPATAVSLPVEKVTDLEAFEGMLVNLDQTLTATEVFNLGRFGEVSLSGAGRLYTGTAVADPGPAALAVIDQNNRSRILLDDGNSRQNIDPTRYPQGGLSASNSLRVGDTLPGLTGVMDFAFSNYRIQPVGPITWTHTNARTAAPDPVGGNLKVASFNVLNFFNGDGLGGGFPTARGANTPQELARQKAKEISALKAINADIVGLMEIENDAAPNSAIEELVAGLNAEMGAGTYAFINTGVIGTDEIKVALIYKSAAVSPVGAYQIITSATDPRFVDTLNRPSLAQTFERPSGARLTVVVSHLKSKGSDCNSVGDPDNGDGAGNCNITRTNAAKALVDWLATDPTGSGDPDVLFIGDFNSYTFEDPIDWITTNGYTNLVREEGGLTPYSYVFNGESGYLDHALASTSLASQVTGVADWHINPDEPNVLDYNVEFKTDNQVNTFYDPGPYRSSDHDPVIIGLNLADPSAPAVQSTTPVNGAVDVAPDASLSVTFTEPVDVTGGWFDITCGASSSHKATVSGGPLTFTIDPDTNFANGESCTWTVYRQNVTDQDTDDPPDIMAADHVVTFRTVFAPPTVDADGPYDVVEGGSVTVMATGTESGGGALIYRWDLDRDGDFETLGQSVPFSAAGLEAPQTLTIAVQATGPTGLTATDEATVNVVWPFAWAPPVLDLPAVNSGGPGKLTLSFSLSGDQGLAILGAGYPASASYTCGEPPPADADDPAAVLGAKGFRYDARSGQYIFDWKASSSWKGTCRVFVLGLADGSTHNLAFQFR